MISEALDIGLEEVNMILTHLLEKGLIQVSHVDGREIKHYSLCPTHNKKVMYKVLEDSLTMLITFPLCYRKALVFLVPMNNYLLVK